ncbi:histidine phosphatase family protein [Ornithinibacillus halotolerans]|uniref:Phosphoglycerate mutase n=1 Tax=Ornithinibacillus halotolerans TaxID=1274357 RepID=A0A916W7Z1_9BACI|nr:histidine phosphatase family protein [Ornithinibacillus halotolerans]GGA74391.1 phosphoglycerate mutase [Ornithinibacillus halotolerans]
MEKNIFVIRHCKATGQSADAPLTEEGFEQAADLLDFFKDKKIDRIVSSPYLRAIQTIEPVANDRYLEIETDNRLIERELSTIFMPDWMDKLEATFYDLELKYEGGESSYEAMNRIVEVVNEMLATNLHNQILVAHGGVISLLLKHYNNDFSYEEWKRMSNPDVFLLKIKGNNITYRRIWEK